GAIAALVLPTGATTAESYAAAAGASRLYMPNVTRTLGGANGWTTPIVLQSVTALGATLNWYRFSDGALVMSEHVTLASGTATWLDPRAIPGLADDAQYSVVADGDGGRAINAIVYEQWLGGSEGASI